MAKQQSRWPSFSSPGQVTSFVNLFQKIIIVSALLKVPIDRNDHMLQLHLKHSQRNSAFDLLYMQHVNHFATTL